MIACILAVLHFRESKNMEAAFGLSVTLTMLITTFLIALYLRTKRVPIVLVSILTALFLSVEFSFLIANSYLSYDNNLPYWRNLLIKSYYNLKLMGVSGEVNYGLDKSNVVFEQYPLVYKKSDNIHLQRI